MKGYQPIHIRFWDHMHSDPEHARPLQCDLLGVLWKEDDLAFYVTAWVCNGDITDSNNEVFTILKSTVTLLQPLSVDAPPKKKSRSTR